MSTPAPDEAPVTRATLPVKNLSSAMLGLLSPRRLPESGEVAGDAVVRRHLAQGHGLGADRLRERAAPAQPAAGGDVDGARDLAAQPQALAPDAGVGDRDRRQERARVGVAR